MRIAITRKDPAFQFVQASIMDEGILENVIRKCELVYHLAAVVGVQNYVAEPRRVPDTTRMRGILGVAAETPLAEGLAATVRYFREPCPRMS